MGAVKGLMDDVREAVETLTELEAFEVKYVLAYDPATGHNWFVVNPWGPEDPEDWSFHALRSGAAKSMAEAVRQLAAAVVRELPDSGFAQQHQGAAA